MLHISNLKFSYSSSPFDGDWILHINNFVIEPGTLYLVKGNNMSGKSTFLNLIAGLLPQGTWLNCLKIKDQKINRIEEIRRQVTILSNSDEMFPELSIWDNIRVALPKNDRSSELSNRNACKTFLGKSDVFQGKSIDDLLGGLSTGGKALVKLCRAHVSYSSLVVIDELTSYLDDDRAIYFLNRILKLVENGESVVIVSHSQRDRSYLEANVARINKVLKKISIVRSGNISELVYEQ